MLLTDCSDETLMRQFCETLDDGVFRIIADRHYGRALHFASVQLGNRTTAYDAVQETLVRVVRHRKRYDPEKPFAPWLFTILRNVCTDFRRKEARHLDALRRSADRVRLPPCSDATENRAKDLLECLGEDDVRLLGLRYGQGLSMAETADRVGCSVEAAKKRFQRVIRRLQAYSSIPDPV